MTAYIPYGKQSICQDDIHEVTKVLASDWLTQGPVIPQFERAISQYCNVAQAVAVSSATAALHLACLALALSPGDILWTSANSFVASANCALYCGANVDFVDIDAKTYNMSVKALAEKLAKAEKIGCLPKIVVPVHFAGQSCEMAEIAALAKKYGFKIIEDASHAIGGSYQDNKVGNCQYSDITVFSFHPVKIITTGEGGILLTKNQNLYESLLRLRSHGITRDPTAMQNTTPSPWYYEQIELGFNYRMTDIQAALGLSQLKKIESFITTRTMKAQYYHEALQDLPVFLPNVLHQTRSAWHLYVIQLDIKNLNTSRLEIFNALRQANIGVNVHYIPIYKQPYYQNIGFSECYLESSEYYYERALTLPLHPSMSERDQMRVISTLKGLLT